MRVQFRNANTSTPNTIRRVRGRGVPPPQRHLRSTSLLALPPGFPGRGFSGRGVPTRNWSDDTHLCFNAAERLRNGNAWYAKSINWTTKIGRQTLIPLITRVIGSSSPFTDSILWIAKFRNAPPLLKDESIIGGELIFACSILCNRIEVLTSIPSQEIYRVDRELIVKLDERRIWI